MGPTSSDFTAHHRRHRTQGPRERRSAGILVPMQRSGGASALRRSARSYEPLTRSHLQRLATIADEDHAYFTRSAGGRPEFADRRVAVVLAQGAAQHYKDCLEGVRPPNGVNDLDLWTFYAQIPDASFPAHKRRRVVDFGPSELGRKRFDMGAADSPNRLAQWRRQQQFTGRPVDLMVRPLAVAVNASNPEVATSLRLWLQMGAQQTPAHRQSNWYLAQGAVVWILPARRMGKILWPPPPA